VKELDQFTEEKVTIWFYIGFSKSSVFFPIFRQKCSQISS